MQIFQLEEGSIRPAGLSNPRMYSTKFTDRVTHVMMLMVVIESNSGIKGKNRRKIVATHRGRSRKYLLVTRREPGASRDLCNRLRIVRQAITNTMDEETVHLNELFASSLMNPGSSVPMTITRMLAMNMRRAA